MDNSIEIMLGIEKKEKDWNETKKQYQKIMIDYKHKKEGLEREKELQLQEQETRDTIENMYLQILQMKSMVAGEEFRQQEVEEEKEKTVLEMLALQKEMLKTNTKFDDFLERYKDLDLVYVSNKLEEYENLVQYELYYVPNDRWKILMLN